MPDIENAETEEKDPFAGFEQAEYRDGEEVKAVPKAPAAAKEEEEEEEEAEGAAEEEAEGAAEEEAEGADDAEAKTLLAERARIERVLREKGVLPKEGRASKRIQELTHRLRKMESKLAAEPPAAAATDAPAKPEDDPARPKKPNPSDFDFGLVDEKYLDARDKWRDDVREYDSARAASAEEEKTQAEADAAYREELQEKYALRVEEGNNLFDDFDEVVVKGGEAGKWPLSSVVGELLVDSDVGAQVAYHLATHPEEAREIFELPAAKQAARFGKLEDKFLADGKSASRGKAAETKPKKATTAPAPLEAPRGYGGKFAAFAESDDFATFERGAKAKTG